MTLDYREGFDGLVDDEVQVERWTRAVRDWGVKVPDYAPSPSASPGSNR